MHLNPLMKGVDSSLKGKSIKCGLGESLKKALAFTHQDLLASWLG